MFILCFWKRFRHTVVTNAKTMVGSHPCCTCERIIILQRFFLLVYTFQSQKNRVTRIYTVVGCCKFVHHFCKRLSLNEWTSTQQTKSYSYHTPINCLLSQKIAILQNNCNKTQFHHKISRYEFCKWVVADYVQKNAPEKWSALTKTKNVMLQKESSESQGMRKYGPWNYQSLVRLPLESYQR